MTQTTALGIAAHVMQGHVPEEQRLSEAKEALASLLEAEAEAKQPKRIDIDACAKRTGLKRSLLSSLVGQGAIPHYRIGKHIVFDAAEIDAWLAARYVPATATASPATEGRKRPAASRRSSRKAPLPSKADRARAARKGKAVG